MSLVPSRRVSKTVNECCDYRTQEAGHLSDATQVFLAKLRSIDALETHAFERLSSMARAYYAGGSR